MKVVSQRYLRKSSFESETQHFGSVEMVELKVKNKRLF